MITTAAEFVALRTSENMAEYHRAAHDEAPMDVWEAVISGETMLLTGCGEAMVDAHSFWRHWWSGADH